MNRPTTSGLKTDSVLSGPFGFKPDELEDAIIEEMNRVWEASKKSKKAKGR